MTPENSRESLWAAPTADAPIVGRLQVPGSKSLTNRALLLACLSDGESQVRGALDARDTSLMIEGLRQLGATITELAPDTEVSADNHRRGQAVSRHKESLSVLVGAPEDGVRGQRRIDCGLAGTVMRFLPAVACLQRGVFEFTGDAAAQARPMGQLLGALTDIGADIDATGSLPFTVTGHGQLNGGAVGIDASASSQFISGLLLAAARFDNGLLVTNTGKSAPSQPHIDMSIRMLQRHGVVVSMPSPGQWHVPAGKLEAHDWVIEPDLSNAMPFFAAAALTEGKVTVSRIPEDSLQPVTQVRNLLHQLGCSTTVDELGLTVSGPTRITAVDVDMSALGELVPTVAALCAFADGPSWLRGIGHIRGHETDRITAITQIFAALGGCARDEGDSICIEPVPLRSAIVPTFADHRLATLGALLGLRTPGVLVEDIATTSKTMPDFPALWFDLVTTVAA